MSTYRIGTVTVNNGSTSVTGSGTSWVAVGVRAGDYLFVNGLFGEVASVESNTALTLVRGWPGGNGSGQQYTIALIDDGQRSIAALNQVLQALGQGTLTSLAALNASANEMPYWTGAGVMGKTALTAAGRALLGRSVIETQSPTDTTSGRLMRVGDFGLGQAGSVPAMPDLNDITFPSGIFRYQLSSLNRPDDTGAGIVLNLSYSAIDKAQLAVRHFSGSSRGTIYSRAYQNNEWTPWRRSYDTQNVLGAVSQSGGVPTGAIIQRGSNSNGKFVRFADGTQMCWHTINLEFSNASTCQTDWFFPAEFSLVGSHSGVIDYGATIGNVAPSTADLQGVGYTNSGSNNAIWRAVVRRRGGATNFVSGNFVRVRLFVIGRWF